MKKSAKSVADSNRKVTEFFPIRRSGRKPKAALEHEHLADIECHLLAEGDNHLELTAQTFPEKGRGVVANRDFMKGDFVVEYSGELLDVGIAKERESKYSMDLTTGCYMYYFKHKGKQYWGDNATTAKPSNKKEKSAKSVADSNRKVTEFFPIRRSGRKPKAALEREHFADIECHLLAEGDDHLELTAQTFPEKGRGVVANRDFMKGEFVVEYSGELIDVGIAKERESKYSMDLTTGCYMYYFKHKGKQYCIDATSESGRLGRLVNHSRLHPNLQTKVVVFKDKPRLILIARKDISSGSELLYDYGDRSKESLKAHPWLAL